MCEHLLHLEQDLAARGVAITHRGQLWSRNCREWVYFACCLDIDSIRSRMKLASCVEVHENLDAKSGTERGLYCTEHHDAIVGSLAPSPKSPLVG